MLPQPPAPLRAGLAAARASAAADSHRILEPGEVVPIAQKRPSMS